MKGRPDSVCVFRMCLDSTAISVSEASGASRTVSRAVVITERTCVTSAQENVSTVGTTRAESAARGTFKFNNH